MHTYHVCIIVGEYVVVYVCEFRRTNNNICFGKMMTIKAYLGLVFSSGYVYFVVCFWFRISNNKHTYSTRERGDMATCCPGCNLYYLLWCILYTTLHININGINILTPKWLDWNHILLMHNQCNSARSHPPEQ